MKKTNVIYVGNINSFALNREYSKITGENKMFNIVSFIDSCTVSETNIEKNRNRINSFKAIIDSDDLIAFEFDSERTLELFDADCYLRDRSIIINNVSDICKAMSGSQLNILLKKISWVLYGKGKMEDLSHKLNEIIYLLDKNNNKRYYIEDLVGVPSYNEITFSIYPVINEINKKDTISNLIIEKLDEIKKDRLWLADKMNIPSATLYGKFQRDSFNIYEVIKIAKIIGLDMNEIKDRLFEN